MSALAGATLRAYDLALRRPWPRIGPRRSGWIVRLSDRDGVTGLGDCAPLPALGTEDAATAGRALADFAAACPGGDPRAALAELDMTSTPAARQAVETALCDLLARRAGLPLFRWLEPRAAARVAVNAVHVPGDGGAAELQAALDAAAAAGFSVFKLKAPDAGATLALLAGLRVPEGLALRLDANRGWDADAAARVLDRLGRFCIDHVEEPLRSPTPHALARLQAAVDFDLAVDESLPELGDDAALAVRRWVLKPMRYGGLLPTLALARRARAADIACNVTSAVESAIGVHASAHLAAAVGGSSAHGLSTGAWLAEDVAEAPAVIGGSVELSERPGLS